MKKVKPIYTVIAALALITVIAAAIHFATRTDVPEGALRVEYGGKAIELDVGRLELSPVQGTVRNGRGEELAVDGKGVPLSAVLTQAKVEEFEQVTVTAEDSYSAVVTAEEVAQPDKVYLLFQEDGARLVVFGDENSKRNVSNVTILTVS